MSDYTGPAYIAFGTEKDETPKVKINGEYDSIPLEELHHGVGAVDISLYGDAPDSWLMKVYGTSEQAVVNTFQHMRGQVDELAKRFV